MRPILFIDRDGVVLEEPASDFQIDHIEKTIFVPGVISNLQKIANEFGYYKVMDKSGWTRNGCLSNV